jgi:hypothetical protein
MCVPLWLIIRDRHTVGESAEVIHKDCGNLVSLAKESILCSAQ